MNASQWLALAPLLVLSAGVLVVMLQIAFLRNVKLTTALSLVTLLLAAASVPIANGVAPLVVTPLLLLDSLALLMCAVFCLTAAATVVLSSDYLHHRGDEPEEYYLLLILSTLGACVLASAVHVASLLLGMELMSIALYALIAYPERSILPLEAAIKYLVLSAAASAVAMFGFALLYAATGALNFVAIGEVLAGGDNASALVLTGAVMVFVGLGFKLSVVPFHLWTPDVYEGAPAPISGFLAAVSKSAVFIVLLRLFLQADLFRYEILIQCIGLMAILSMLAGNLLALLQTNLKRMLGYSSIAHIGYLLIIYMAILRSDNPDLATEAAVYYLIAYSVTTVAAFGVLALISCDDAERERVDLQQVSGLFWRQPLLAILLMAALLSLAGIPLTAGFIAKFYIIAAAVSGHNWILLATLAAASALGIYYYLRVVFYTTRQPEDHPVELAAARGWKSAAIASALIAAILWLGILPQPLMAYIRSIL